MCHTTHVGTPSVRSANICKHSGCERTSPMGDYRSAKNLFAAESSAPAGFATLDVQIHKIYVNNVVLGITVPCRNLILQTFNTKLWWLGRVDLLIKFGPEIILMTQSLFFRGLLEVWMHLLIRACSLSQNRHIFFGRDFLWFFSKKTLIQPRNQNVDLIHLNIWIFEFNMDYYGTLICNS